MGQNPYSPHTDADRAAMLATIGIASVDELLTAVPKDAVRLTGRRRVVVANEVFSQFRQTLATYAKGPELDVVELPASELAANAAGAACLIVQHPDAFGTLVDVRPIADAAHSAGGLCVQ